MSVQFHPELLQKVAPFIRAATGTSSWWGLWLWLWGCGCGVVGLWGEVLIILFVEADVVGAGSGQVGAIS